MQKGRKIQLVIQRITNQNQPKRTQTPEPEDRTLNQFPRLCSVCSESEADILKVLKEDQSLTFRGVSVR